jgi:hypothetical protein
VCLKPKQPKITHRTNRAPIRAWRGRESNKISATGRALTHTPTSDGSYSSDNFRKLKNRRWKYKRRVYETSNSNIADASKIWWTLYKSYRFMQNERRTRQLKTQTRISFFFRSYQIADRFRAIGPSSAVYRVSAAPLPPNKALIHYKVQ